MIVERLVPRLGKKRAAAQLIEEALLLSVALLALSLLVGGVDSVLKQAGGLTSNIWTSINSNLSNLFNTAFHW
jgi:hypothetical protein